MLSGLKLALQLTGRQLQCLQLVDSSCEYCLETLHCPPVKPLFDVVDVKKMAKEHPVETIEVVQSVETLTLTADALQSISVISRLLVYALSLLSIVVFLPARRHAGPVSVCHQSEFY